MNYEELLKIGAELSVLSESKEKKIRKISQDPNKLQVITMSKDTFEGLIDEFLKAANTNRKLTKSEIKRILNQYFQLSIVNKEIEDFEKSTKKV